MANTKQDKVKDATGQDERAPWETQAEDDNGSRAADEMALFVAPESNQWRRPLTEAELMNWVATQAQSNSADGGNIGQSIFAQVAAYASIDDMMAGRVDTTKGKDIIGKILEIHGIKFLMGDQPDGCPWYAHLDARVTDTEGRDTISIGGWMVMAQLGRLHYSTVTLPADSQYLVAEGTPGAQEKQTPPFYFRVKEKPTQNGAMKYLVTPLQS